MSTNAFNFRTTLCREFDAIHPIAKKQFFELYRELQTAYDAGETRTQFRPFETFRHPLRQAYLKAETEATSAGAFQSAHQYGLAVDFVPYVMIGGKMAFSWDKDHDYDFLRKTAWKHNLLVPIGWDKCHVQHPLFEELRTFLRHWQEKP